MQKFSIILRGRVPKDFDEFLGMLGQSINYFCPICGDRPYGLLLGGTYICSKCFETIKRR